MVRIYFNLRGFQRRRVYTSTTKLLFTKIFFTTTLLISSVPVFSAPPNTDNTNYVTDPIIVTATRFPTSIPSAPTNVTIINDSDIEHSTVNNLSQALQVLGGVQVNDLFGISGAKSSIDLGGFGESSGQNSLVLVNGRRLNDVDLSGANLAAIPLQSIKRIEIIHGNASVLYGDNAANGVINIVTKTGFDNQHSSISLSEGSFHTTKLRGSLANSLANDTTALALFLDYFNSKGYRRNSAFRNFNAQMEISRQLNDGLIGMRFNSANEHMRFPGELSESDYLSDPKASNQSKEFLRETRHLIEAYYNSERIAGELSYREKQQSSLLFGNINATLRTLAFTPRMTLSNNNNQLVAGIDYYRSRLGTLSDFSAPNINTSYTTRDSAALYLSNQYHLDHHNSMGLGLRRESVRVDINNINPSTSASKADSRGDGEYAWDINYNYRYNTAATAYLRIARGFRFPVLDEMWDYFFGTINTLKPQTSTRLELGGNLQLNHSTSLQADLFHTKLRNEIAFDASTYTNLNLDPTRHDGINLQLTKQLGKGNRIRASYGYRKALFSEGPYAGKSIPLVASRNFSLAQQYETPMGNVFSIDTVYTGSRYFGDDNNNSGKQMPAYTRINLGYKIKLAQGYLKTTINNVTDVKTANLGYYRSYYLPASPYTYYPLPERSVFVELGFSL